MKVSVFGMGYVGVVCSACFARRGHEVIGVDISTDKVASINQAKAPIVEPGLPELLAEVSASGRLRATTDVTEAVLNSEISFICVGTPSRRNGDLDLSHVDTVCRQIGATLRDKEPGHIVVIRSTVLPGTLRNIVIPALEEASGKRVGSDFHVAVNPEFLRESTAIKDFDHPPFTIIGAESDTVASKIALLYEGVPGALVVKQPEVAEMIKYTCNAWHATKVAFANEIGAVAKAMDVDGRDVMDVVCQDQILNISTYYMRPGFAFGGSCLPKDLRALTYRANQLDIQLPLLYAMLDSNNAHIDRGFELITAQPARRIGLMGLSFKAGTDDLRESPFVELAERLLGKGYDLRIYDKNVEYARVHGANREYINAKIPHLSNLLVPTLDQLFQHAELLVVSYPDAEFRAALAEPPAHCRILDLTGIAPAEAHSSYEGICW